MTQELPPLPEPLGVVQMWGCGVDVYSASQIRDAQREAIASVVPSEAGELADLRAKLQDPVLVHVAMLRGEIAKPDFRSMLHVYGADALARWDAAAVAPVPPQSVRMDADLQEAMRRALYRSAKVLNEPVGASALSAAPAAPVQPAPLMDRHAGFIKPDNDHQVFFYEQDFYVLSNFSAFRVSWERIDFDTSEHAYHWEKFRCEAGWTVAMQIIDARSAHEAFKLAERNKALRRSDWDDIKVDVMRGILRAKAQQHEYVRRKLLGTGDRELIEDSWRDDFWGWGPNRNGKNMLGKLWMELRSELRAKACTTSVVDAGDSNG